MVYPGEYPMYTLRRMHTLVVGWGVLVVCCVVYTLHLPYLCLVALHYCEQSVEAQLLFSHLSGLLVCFMYFNGH